MEAQVGEMVRVLDRYGQLDGLWVFGSQAEGKATATSDVDLAALFAARPPRDALFSARLEIEELLRKPVDLIDIEAASPILAMQVLRRGRVLRNCDAAHMIRFAAALPGRYEDVILLRRPLERLLRERLAGG